MNQKTTNLPEEQEVKIYTPRYQSLHQQQLITTTFQDHAPVRIYQQPIKPKSESKQPDILF